MNKQTFRNTNREVLKNKLMNVGVISEHEHLFQVIIKGNYQEMQGIN